MPTARSAWSATSVSARPNATPAGTAGRPMPIGATGRVGDVSPAAHIARCRNLRELAERRRRLVVLDHSVDDVVLLGLLGAHEVVALGVLRNLLHRVLGVLGDDLVEAPAHVDDLLGVDLDVGRRALKAAGDLMDE